MCKIFKLYISYLCQIINLSIDIITLYNFNINERNYLVLSMISGIVVNFIISLGLGCYMFSKFENDNKQENYLKKHYFFILIFTTIFPPANIYIFILNDEKIFEISEFIFDLLDLPRTLFIYFPSIYFNIYQFFTLNGAKLLYYYFNILCLISNIFFASLNLMSLHVFTYNNRIDSILDYIKDNPFPLSMIEEIKKYKYSNEYTSVYKLLTFLIFFSDFYGYSILWGIYSYLQSYFSWIIICFLFLTCLFYNLITIPYYGCRKCFTDSKEEEAAFSFDFIDNILSVICLPFGPISLSLIYFLIKLVLAISYISYSLYLIFFDFDKLNMDYIKIKLFYSGLLCLCVFSILYPIFLCAFNNLKKTHIEKYREKRKSKQLLVTNVKVFQNDEFMAVQVKEDKNDNKVEIKIENSIAQKDKNHIIDEMKTLKEKEINDSKIQIIQDKNILQNKDDQSSQNEIIEINTKNDNKISNLQEEKPEHKTETLIDKSIKHSEVRHISQEDNEIEINNEFHSQNITNKGVEQNQENEVLEEKYNTENNENNSKIQNDNHRIIHDSKKEISIVKDLHNENVDNIKLELEAISIETESNKISSLECNEKSQKDLNLKEGDVKEINDKISNNEHDLKEVKEHDKEEKKEEFKENNENNNEESLKNL